MIIKEVNGITHYINPKFEKMKCSHAINDEVAIPEDVLTKRAQARVDISNNTTT